MENLEEEKLVLEGRRNLNISCVESVDGFSEQILNLTVKGCKLKVLGEGLKIINFNQSSGNFSCEGKVNEMRFNYKKQPLLKKIFK